MTGIWCISQKNTDSIQKTMENCSKYGSQNIYKGNKLFQNSLETDWNLYLSWIREMGEKSPRWLHPPRKNTVSKESLEISN